MLILLAPIRAYATGERVALVIGNSAYQHVETLPNAAQDARDVAQVLERIGFRVMGGVDLTRAEILSYVQQVQASLSPEDVALFYFAGHAVQIGAENFLIPVDASGQDEETLKKRSVKLQSILAGLERRADRNVIILDACRNNPFDMARAARSFGTPTRGLAKVDAGVGSFIAFSTQPGNVALDGEGRNSPFTAALLQHLPSQQDDLHEVMRKVRRDVVAQTNSIQIPWENSSLIDRIYLAGRPAATPAPAPLPQVVQPAPSPQAVPQRVPGTYDYMVSGLDPNGDGFLALRSGTTATATRLSKMAEGTRLRVLGQDGVWFQVQTEFGAVGWAHSNWIRFVGIGTTRPAETCDSLWLQRNTIFARNGYCFQSARGQRAFSNAGCRQGVPAGQIPLTAAERQEVARLVARETALQCR